MSRDINKIGDSMIKEEVIEKIQKDNIKFIDLMFTDITGAMKSITIPPSEIEHALDDGVWFDGSSIEGFVRVHESDMVLMPDPSTYVRLPWTSNEKPISRMICDVNEPSGDPFLGDPRFILKQVMAEAKEMGYIYNTGPEIEFFLFKSREQEGKEGIKSVPIRNSHIDYFDFASYFDFSPRDLATDVRGEMATTLEELGIIVEASHHEVAPSQHEIDIRYSDALTSADNVMVFKHAIKIIAHKHNIFATFMPKPIAGINGSGMHTHQSLFDEEGNNLFFDPDDNYKLSKLAYWFMAGQMKFIREISAVLAPTVNSYKRLVVGYEAPVYICWAHRNRSALIRVPRYSRGRERATRLELRCPDPSCNPYLAFAAMLKAGLQGIKEKIEPPGPVEEDVYEFDDRKLAKFYIQTLPENLNEAIEEFEKSELMKKTLGEHIFSKFLVAKKAEWDLYRMQISEWERQRYMDI